ncbi:TIGR02449 family protein [Motiliproteus sp. SC1-56]|uniref:TIGR02449 family protein n=1 Tax=Motiliproteus sp. SC1-56 TaxID=2799565 RepID=UPI001A8E8C72|nr:TIGR02449 family protein [Motiliproteus sp. SC1-56]
MADQTFNHLEQQIERLVAEYQQLQKENRLLRQREAAWKSERAQLIQTQEATRGKVEAMINRLKAMEQN